MKWCEEQGQIIKSLGPFIDKRMRERRVYCRREQMTSVADKPTRSRSFQARCAMGKVYFPHNAHWAADLQSELLTFPTGKHDDQVDALGMIGRMLDTMVGGRAPATDTSKRRTSGCKPSLRDSRKKTTGKRPDADPKRLCTPTTSTVLRLRRRQDSLEAMIQSTKRGLLMGRFSGGSPAANGDFSGVAKNSFLIENGQVTKPVSEVMISGNAFELMRSISAISEERVNDGGTLTPWVKVEGLTVAGAN